MDRYLVWHGRYWMFQFSPRIFLSFGVHIDFELKYVDFHLGAVILTFGDMERQYTEYRSWASSREK